MIYLNKHQAKAAVIDMMAAFRRHGSYTIYYNNHFSDAAVPFLTTIPCEPFDAFVTAHEHLHQARSFGKNVYILNSDGKCVHSSVKEL